MEALDKARAGTRPVASAWLGLIPLAETAKLPSEMATCVPVTSVELARYRSRAYIDPRRPPRFARADRPLKTHTGPDGKPQPRSRFIWFTFEYGGTLPEDATTLARELGLAHLATGPSSYLYRATLPVDPTRLHIPSCFDGNWLPG